MNPSDDKPLQKTRFLTTEEAAALLRQSQRTISAWAIAYQKSGGKEGIQGVKLGRRWLFDHAEIMALAPAKNLGDSHKQHSNVSPPAATNIVQPYDYCSTTAVTEELRHDAAGAVYENVRSILLSRPADERRPLPDGIEALIASLGDPGYGIVVIQVEPTEEVDRLKRLLHEIKHVEERLEDKIRSIESEKKPKEKRRPPRAGFS
jgi:hypothetical protein